MKVYKFGGASLKDDQSFENLTRILSKESDPLLVVVSAIGKTTNQLETLLNAHLNKLPERFDIFHQIKTAHWNILNSLFHKHHLVYFELITWFDALLEILINEPEQNFDFEYDRVVSFGEFFSSVIVSAYLNNCGLKNKWLDATAIIIAEEIHRDAGICWDLTSERIKSTDFLQHSIYLTQGFIAGTPTGKMSTLGREGSDYSAAIFASLLDATEVVVWKDVAGVYNADPVHYPDARPIPVLSYSEAIELSYFGAKVIHPKTIKPLQNKNIPLWVKSFIHPELAGTLIQNTTVSLKLPPIIIHKENQILLSITPLDFSFIREEHLSRIFGIFARARVTINVSEISALSLSVCSDDDPHRIPELLKDLNLSYAVRFNKDCELLTVRHYHSENLTTILNTRKVLLEQRNRTTVRWVLK